MKPIRASGRDSVRHHSVLPRFRDAFRGIYQTYREEPNFRFHCFAATCVLLGAYAVKLEGWETAYLLLTVVSVFLAEMVNTAVERAVDFAADGRLHPLAGQAKEVAAGAVLLTALHAAFAAGLLFVVWRGPLETLQAVLSLAAAKPWLLLAPAAAGVLGLVGGSR